MIKLHLEILILALILLIGSSLLGYLIDYRDTMESIKKNKKYYYQKLKSLFKTKKVDQKEFEKRIEKFTVTKLNSLTISKSEPDYKKKNNIH
ncbi:MAG: hypothetical protein HeimC3_32280 [Candidatus Heimdallarchaeota archaeon LC_3]|nr:MAG: hypothetical protein HeimC3_32280 [Candidatus Heimdallarchaeota archaeon LC_3]